MSDWTDTLEKELQDIMKSVELSVELKDVAGLGIAMDRVKAMQEKHHVDLSSEANRITDAILERGKYQVDSADTTEH